MRYINPKGDVSPERPSDDEIARVKAWRREEGAERTRKWNERRREIEAAVRAKLTEEIVGRRIEVIEGDLDHSNWRKVVLVLEGGVRFSVEYSSFSDPPELDVDVEGPR